MSHDRTDEYDNWCSTSSGQTRSEPNHILEINEAHADNFMLVIPKLPTAQYLSSYFSTFTQAKELFGTVGPTGTPSPSGTGTSGTSGISGCPAGPEEELDDTCETGSFQRDSVMREGNLDLANFKLFISDVTLPNVNINAVTLGTQFADINRSSKIQFGDLTTTMLVSENFLNYNAMLYWLYALHNPEEYNKIFGRFMIEDFYTNIHLIITNNHRQKVAEYTFYDAFPNVLTPVPFSYKNADKITSDITWKFSGMVPSDNFVLRFV